MCLHDRAQVSRLKSKQYVARTSVECDLQPRALEEAPPIVRGKLELRRHFLPAVGYILGPLLHDLPAVGYILGPLLRLAALRLQANPEVGFLCLVRIKPFECRTLTARECCGLIRDAPYLSCHAHRLQFCSLS